MEVGIVSYRRFKERAIGIFFAGNGVVVILLLLAILYLLGQNSWPFFKEVGFLKLFTDNQWNPTSFFGPIFGIRPMMISTIMVTAGALAIAFPLGVACAAYLAKMAVSWEREILKPFVEILAGIPSVVIGFFGLVVLNPIIARIFGLSNGLNVLNGSILLAIMALPTVISLAEDALTAVPKSFEEGSLALGATPWQTLWRVTLPAAKSGIAASFMLGMGRAIGETMTVLMVMGNVLAAPGSFLDPGMTMTAVIAIELGEVPFNTTHYFALFAVGLVLFIMTFLVNLASDLILNRFQGVEK